MTDSTLDELAAFMRDHDLRELRRRRDAMIVAALRNGAGVREVARLVKLNPSTVMAIRDRAAALARGIGAPS